MMYRHPMLAMATLVAAGFARRPPLQAYLQHDGWRAIWMHALESSSLQPSDEFAELQMIRPLEKEFMERAGVVEDALRPTKESARGIKVDPPLRAMMDEYGIPMEVIKNKYVSYAAALRASGRESNWNADVDTHGYGIGAITPKEITAARIDLHQAILNRIKIALVSEGWLRSDLDE